jgi:hypothetical protein
VKLDPMLLAWMAGFLDGEGCVTISSKAGSIRHKKKTPWLSPYVTVSNRNRGVLELFKACFGGYIVSMQRKKTHHSPCWAYMACNTKATEMLKALRPYLRVKAMHADTVLRFSETMHNDRGCRGYTEREHEIRNYFLSQIRIMNQKGVANETVQ